MLTGNKLAGPEPQAGWVSYSSTIHPRILVSYMPNKLIATVLIP